jgi:hypothetical protein
MNYIMLINFSNDATNSPQQREQFKEFVNLIIVVKPAMCMLMNIVSAIIFFIASVLIDTKNMNSFRRNDRNQVRWQPRYL